MRYFFSLKEATLAKKEKRMYTGKETADLMKQTSFLFFLNGEAGKIPITTGSSSLDSRSLFITVVMTICPKSRSKINQRHPTLWCIRSHLHGYLYAFVWAWQAISCSNVPLLKSHAVNK